MKNRYLSAALFLSILFFPKNIAAQNITVNIVGPTVMCAGQCDTFFAELNPSTIPSGNEFKWTVTGSNGFTTSGTTDELFFCASDTPIGSGYYNFIVSVSNGNGFVIASDTLTVLVLSFLPLNIISSNPAPCNVDSSSSDPNNSACEKTCPNTTVTYSVHLSNNPGGTQTALSWQVQGASSFTVNPPFNNSVTVTWGAPGVGSVSVFSDGITGCTGEDAICVTIIAEPVAQFTADPVPVGNAVQICKGQTVYFDNQSAGADGYEWLFSDDLSTSLETDPEHTFLTPGNYTVRLIARSDCLCSDTTTLNVEVLDAVAPTLDCVGTICPGETVTYTASNACPPYTWSVTPNGSILSGGISTSDSITVQWDAGPEGIITLGALPCSGNVCPNPASIHIPIVSDDAEIRGAERVCPAAVEVYTIEPYGGTDFIWSLSGGGTITEGQGTNRVTVAWTDFPNANTTYWLSVKYNNCYLGCGGEDSIAVKVLSPFTINGPVERCEDANGNFTSKLTYNGQNIACNWTLYAPDGSVVWTSPAASAAVSVPFANGAGIYRVLAEPDDPNMTCSNLADWAVSIAPQPAKPTSILGEKNICVGTTYTYAAAGVSPTNNLRWTVQNGSGAPVVSFGNKINVTWGSANPRWISVVQVSTNGLNCTSDTALLTVQNIGLVFITGDQVVCEDATANYAIIALENVDIQWQISPPTAGTVANGQGTNAAEIFWTEPGGHVVSMDVCGQMSIIPVTVIALPDPTVQHSASVCPGKTTLVQTTTPYISYSWRDASGVEISAAPTTNLGVGSYSVRVEDLNGCVGVSEFTITENSTPNVSITTADPTGFCNNSSFVTLTALTNANGDFTYEWFNNGTPLGVNAPTLTTNQYGNYTVQATNTAGCSATVGTIVLFNFCGGPGGGGGFPGGGPPPCPAGSVDFTANATAECDSFGFQLIASPQYQPGSAFWTFGISGGSVLGTSAVENPGFNFPNAGKYIIVLRAMLQNGSSCIVVDSVNVLASAQFSALPACANEATAFQDVSTFLPGSGVSNWDWNFGDPPSGGNNISNLGNPTHLYGSAGNPVVTLTITANNGCTSSASQTLLIPGGIPAPFAPPVLQCAGNALEFLATTTPEVTEVKWNFGDLSSGPANDATGNPTYHSFTSPSNYAVTTTTTNAYGCKATFTQIITIAPNGLSGTIAPANPGPVCEGKTITLTAPPGAVSYLWSDSLTTTQTFIAGEEGTYTVTMTDANGCTYIPPPVNIEITPGPDALIKALLENELGQIIGVSYPTLTTCEGEDVHLFAQGNGSYTYSWSGGNGFDNEVFFTDDRNNLLSVGNHIYTVTVTDVTSGCTSVTDPFVVTVNPVPSGFSISTSGSCAGDANVLTYSGPQPANWQFIWNNGAPGTSLTTEDPGLYFIRVVNEFGCEAKSAPLTILPGPNVVAIPGGCHTRCKPDTLCLPPIPNIVSWQWYFDGSPIPGATSPDFVATQSGAYYAELTDIFGCTNQSDPLTLNLFDGFGNISGQVWSDVNDNGVVDAGDTLVSGIAVNLLQNGNPAGTGQSGTSGDFSFVNVLSTNYVVEIDLALLPPGWSIVIGQNPVALSGCDVSAETDLLLNLCPPLSSSLSLSACAGATVTYNGTTLSAGATQDFLFTTSSGCDSTVTVTVTSLPTSSSTLPVKVCAGETYNYNGTVLAAGETEDFIFPNYLGCDSTVTVSVSEYSLTQMFVDAVACEGDTLFYNGVGIPAGSGYTFTYQNAAGCDTFIVSVAVGVLPTPPALVWQIGVCPGEVYTFGGDTLVAGDTAQYTLPAVAGCDTALTIIVTALQASTSLLSAGVCPGETYDYQGVALAAGSVTDFTFDNWLGCDSIVTVTVQAFPVSAEVLEVAICPGTTYNFDNTDIPAGDTAVFHYLTQEGCDSIVTVMVAAFPEATFDVFPETSCANKPTGSLAIAGAVGGLPPYRYSLDGVAFQDSALFEVLPAGDYTVYLEDSNGCIFENDTNIAPLPPLEVVLPDGILPCDNSGTRLEAFIGGDLTGLKIKWFNGDTTTSVNVADPGPVWVEATNQCETVRREAAVNWDGAADAAQLLYVPNVIKPASFDPDNSGFKPFFQDNLTIVSYQLEVFDRWGNKLFSTQQPDAAWHGRFRADEMNPGVYVWYIRAKALFCGQERDLYFEGDVTVVR